MSKHEFITSVKQGKLGGLTAKNIKTVIANYEGMRIILTIDKCSSKRSNQQNSYIHLLFTMLTDALNDLGNEFTMLEVKELMKAKYLLIDVVNEKTGEVLGQRIKGTSECTTVELNTFFENVIRWAAELGIILPMPNEELEIDF